MSGFVFALAVAVLLLVEPRGNVPTIAWALMVVLLVAISAWLHVMEGGSL